MWLPTFELWKVHPEILVNASRFEKLPMSSQSFRNTNVRAEVPQFLFLEFDGIKWIATRPNVRLTKVDIRIHSIPTFSSCINVPMGCEVASSLHRGWKSLKTSQWRMKPGQQKPFWPAMSSRTTWNSLPLEHIKACVTRTQAQDVPRVRL